MFHKKLNIKTKYLFIPVIIVFAMALAGILVEGYIRNYKLYYYQETQGGWSKISEAPVLGNSETGTLFDPDVIIQDNTYLMYVSKRSDHSIVLSKSEDGIKWGGLQEVLMPEENSDWEQKVNRANVINKDGIWYMWYTGQADNVSSIGVATSSDGKNFKKFNKNPIIISEYDHEGVSVMNPCVIWDGEEQVFKMWYAAGENYEPDVLCYAVSKDGFTWKKYKQNPVLFPNDDEIYDQKKVGGCDVIKLPDQSYIMFYIGYQDVDTARICLAASSDGIDDWTRISDNPIISASKNSWDRYAVYKPSAYYNKDKQTWYLWYNGRGKDGEFIGAVFNKCKIYNIID
ncbi:MAG: hypothetical protein WCD89_07070 [Anaerocolumna sp.]